MAEPNGGLFMFHAIKSRVQVACATVTYTDMHSGVGHTAISKRSSLAPASKC